MTKEKTVKKSNTKKDKAKKKAAPKATPAPKTPSPQYKGSFYSSDYLKPDFVKLVKSLEVNLGQKVALLWHDGRKDDDFAELNEYVYLAFAQHIKELPKEKITVLVFSPGGSARPAFKLATLLRKHCGGYTVIVPLWAKSAATLFSLGADKIVMSQFAELGPLDAQVDDKEREQRISALEVVQAIERLNSEAMNAIDQQMRFWLIRSGKKIDTILPVASHFVAEMMQPLFNKIDAVQYTGMARLLKVAQDYAQRLLKSRGIESTRAEYIADKLTNAYSDHEYVIDCAELLRAGYEYAEEASGEVASIIEEMVFLVPNVVSLGPVKEV